jgi:tetratricopeptide (TPR) repeat protein
MGDLDVNASRRRAHKASERAYAAMAREKLDNAYRHIVIASDNLERAVELADDADDILSLAAILRRRADIADELGSGDDAIAAARKTVELIEKFDVSHGDPDAVADAIRSARTPFAMLNHATGGATWQDAPSAATAAARFMKWHGAAKLDLARFLAKHGRPGSGGEIRYLGSTSVETLRRLKLAGDAVDDFAIDMASEDYGKVLAILVQRAQETIAKFRSEPDFPGDRDELVRTAADAGEEGIRALRALAEAVPAYRPELIRAVKLEKQQRKFDPKQAVEVERERIATLIEQAEEVYALASQHSRAGRLDRAVEATEDALGKFRQIAVVNRWYRRMVAMALFSLGSVRERSGDVRAAYQAMREAAVVFESVYRNDDHRFRDEAVLARKELRRLRRVRLGLSPRRR